MMATVTPKQPKKEWDHITIRLDCDVVQTQDHYCRYLESGRDYVINQRLTFVFRKDKPFLLLACRPGNRQLAGHCGRRRRGITARCLKPQEPTVCSSDTPIHR